MKVNDSTETAAKVILAIVYYGFFLSLWYMTYQIYDTVVFRG